jgi:putative ABC transport system substrate-binding protein
MTLRRRDFITLLGGAAVAWPITARAQQPARRIGVMVGAAEGDALAQTYVTAFSQALRSLGWGEGQLQVEIRWNGGSAELARKYAAELVALAPDVIVAATTNNLTALQRLSPTTPIVFLEVSDPVAQGFVLSQAHPGGNITGFSYFEVQTAGKWLDLLKQMAPEIARIAVIFNPDTAPPARLFSSALKGAAPAFGVEVLESMIHATPEIEPVIERLAREPHGALIFPPDQYIHVHRDLVVELAARHRLPAIYAREGFAEVGGLVSYYPLEIEQFRQAASYVDRILRGAKPGDLPVQAPTKFELIVNLKTAKALGLTVPLGLLAGADAVIE